MDKRNILETEKSFDVLLTDKRSQVAVMVLEPGDESGPKGNEHASSEQVLLVVSGEVQAEIGEDRDDLKAGDVVIVPMGADHRFVNTGKRRAVTVNVYAPPAY